MEPAVLPHRHGPGRRGDHRQRVGQLHGTEEGLRGRRIDKVIFVNILII